jgi:hypothetical protein
MKKLKLHYPDPGMTLHGVNACLYHPFEKYNPAKDINKPCMFWLYFESDYKLFSEHKGKKYVFWHNSDVKTGQPLNYRPELLKYYSLLRDNDVVHVTHNTLLRDDLAMIGIHAIVRPVFWGDINKYKSSDDVTKDIYMCSNPGRGVEYGEFIFNALAGEFPKWNFHIFGIDPTVSTYRDNVKYYGWITESEMDDIVSDFAICIRWNLHDGCANVILKALLMEQYCITTIDYSGLTNVAKSYSEIVKMIKETEKEEYNIFPNKHIKSIINNFDFIA